MAETIETAKLSRRGFLRAATGGALALTTGNLLSGCGSGGGGVPPIHGRDMYVSTFVGNTIERFDAVTGAHKQTINTGMGPAGLALGLENDLFTALRFGAAVERYDLTSGKRIGALEYVLSPHSVAMGTDGSLYVPNALSYVGYPTSEDTIERFDARTGQHLGTFAHMAMPFSLVWGPDNNLYASTALELGNTHPNSDYILRFNGSTGALMDTVVPHSKVPFDMVFTNHNTILVTQFVYNEILEYDLASGNTVRTFANINTPIGIAYGPDGNIYVGSFSNPIGSKNSGSVQVFDPVTGASKGTFVSGLSYAAFIVFV